MGSVQPVQEVLGRMVRSAVPFRFGGALLLATVATLHAAYDPVPWKIAAPAGMSVVLAALVPIEQRVLPPVLSARQVAWFLFPVQCGISVLATTTGGIESPFLLLMPMISFATVVGTGEPRYFGPGLAGMAALGWAFGITELMGSTALHPAIFGDPVALSPVKAMTDASFLTVALVVPAILGLHFRRTLDRAVNDAIAARAESVATLEETNAEIVALTRAVAHELKNPLAAIQGLAGVVARKQVPGSKEAERMDVLLAETRRLGGLLDEFLGFGRLARGLVVRPVEPSTLVKDIVLLYEARAREGRVALDGGVYTARPLRGDPRKLRQVLVNLVGNALDATPPGGRVRVEVADAPDGGHELLVVDDGPGIAPEVAGRLFQAGVTTKPGGSGLGLAIARTIAQQHGGTLVLEARPGGGCRAQLLLPREPREPSAEAS